MRYNKPTLQGYQALAVVQSSAGNKKADMFEPNQQVLRTDPAYQADE